MYASGFIFLDTLADGARAQAVAEGLKPNQLPAAFVNIDAKGIVTVMVNRLDFGQGDRLRPG